MSVFADFHVSTTAYPLGIHLAEYPEVSVEIERIVPTGEPTHYVRVTGENPRDFIEEIRGDASIREFTVVDEFPDRVLIRIERDSLESPLFELAEAVEATPISVRGTHEGWTISLRFADRDDLEAFFEASEDRGLPLELREIYGSNGVDDEAEYGLTAIQRETLRTALEAGYFEVPRRITLAELAERIDVSEQALSERLRRGLSALLASTGFDGTPGSSADEETR